MLVLCVLLSHQIVDIICICCFCHSFVAWYFVCYAQACAAIISHSVSPAKLTLDSHTNMSSSLISCLSILLIYWPCISLLTHFFLRTLLMLLLYAECLPFLCHYSHFIQFLFNICCFFNCWVHIWLGAFMAFKILQTVFFILCVQTFTSTDTSVC